MHIEVLSVKELNFSQFKIPEYQRPYKWTLKNVNQLINDIIFFKNRDKKRYRLGTLVLHDNGNELEIVDGQQRIVTLSLILSNILQKIQEKKETYKKVYDSVREFQKTKFSNRYSLYNAIENSKAIRKRFNEIDAYSVVDFILDKCEFVVITIKDLSEAFQFFDSQNARGKDLEAHDLLKAYHLREISDFQAHDKDNINFWQQLSTEHLSNIFLTLYRAKRWSQGKSALYFTKNEIEDFKGISIKNGKRYSFHHKDIVAHIFTESSKNRLISFNDLQKLNCLIELNDLIKLINECPFNLDDNIINGSRFFDMIRHYVSLYENITSFNYSLDEKLSEKSSEIIGKLLEYYKNKKQRRKTGMLYIKNMFDSLVLYYMDRFGKEELNRIIPLFFTWAYKLLSDKDRLPIESVNNKASNPDSMFILVHKSNTPDDIIKNSDINYIDYKTIIEEIDKLEK